ncbi:MAG: ABC transporter ATP-binding protein [Anaerofustis sp.]
MKLEIQTIKKTFPSENGEKTVLSGLSLSVAAGEFIAVVGKSGCGKSTLLRLIGGFEKPDEGSILLDGKPILAPSKEVMMIFQDDAQLFPWMSLEENLRYALKKTVKPYDASTAQPIIDSCLRDTGLEEFRSYYPSRLSGGMKQRGALARALALRSDVLLMDEPFSSLDWFNRRNAQELVKALWEKNGNTILFVTHDIEEALFLAQKTAVIDAETHTLKAVLDNSTQTKESLMTLLK